MSPKLRARLAEYETYHQNEQNHRLHYAGIPLITFAVLGAASFVGGLPFLSLAEVLWITVALWAARLDLAWGLGFAAVLYFMLLSARETSPGVLVACFVVGWFFQFWGHYQFEKKSPAFFKNLEHLLVGPFWVFVKLVQRLRGRPTLGVFLLALAGLAARADETEPPVRGQGSFERRARFRLSGLYQYSEDHPFVGASLAWTPVTPLTGDWSLRTHYGVGLAQATKNGFPPGPFEKFPYGDLRLLVEERFQDEWLWEGGLGFQIWPGHGVFPGLTLGAAFSPAADRWLLRALVLNYTISVTDHGACHLLGLGWEFGS